MLAESQTIDEYLAPLSIEKRAALEKLRRAIKAAAPKPQECISYQALGPTPLPFSTIPRLPRQRGA